MLGALNPGYDAPFSLVNGLYKILSARSAASAAGLFVPDPADSTYLLLLAVARNARCTLKNSRVRRDALSRAFSGKPSISVDSSGFEALPDPFRSAADFARRASFLENREHGTVWFVLHDGDPGPVLSTLESADSASRELFQARLAARAMAEHSPHRDFQSIRDRAALANSRYIGCVLLHVSSLARAFALKMPSAVTESLPRDLLGLVRYQLASTGTAFPARDGAIAVVSFARTRPDPELVAEVLRRSIARRLGLDDLGSGGGTDAQVVDLESKDAAPAWQSFSQRFAV